MNCKPISSFLGFGFFKLLQKCSQLRTLSLHGFKTSKLGDANFDEVDKKLWLYMVTIMNISTLIGLHVLNTEQTFFYIMLALTKLQVSYLLFFAWKFCYELIVQNLALKGGF